MNTIEQLTEVLRARERFGPDPESVAREVELALAGEGVLAPRRLGRGRRVWPRPLLLAAVCVLLVVAVSLAVVHGRSPNAEAPPNGHNIDSTAPIASRTAESRPADSSPPTAVRPVVRSGPLAMVPGTPGVNASNQAEQTKPGAGGRAMLLIVNGCVRVWLGNGGTPVAVFDSSSTDWDGTTLTYWGVPIPFGQLVMTGFGASAMKDLRTNPDAYVPEGCPDDGEVVYLNTLEPWSGNPSVGWRTGTVVGGSRPDSFETGSGVVVTTQGHSQIAAHWDAGAEIPPRHLLVTTWGSSSCAAPLAIAAVTRTQQLTLIPADQVTAVERSCTADFAPYTTRVAVPDQVTSTKPLTLIIDDVTLVVPPAHG